MKDASKNCVEYMVWIEADDSKPECNNTMTPINTAAWQLTSYAIRQVTSDILNHLSASIQWAYSLTV